MTRRELLLKYPACGSVALVQLASYTPVGHQSGTLQSFTHHAGWCRRASVESPTSRRGEGQAALFLHGLPLNGYFWRGALARLSAHRRCIAPDFMGLGYTVTDLAQTLSPSAQADMIAAFLDALSIGTADVVANDSGGAIAQLLATRYPARVRTLLLTNCDVHTNCPPAVLAPVVAAASRRPGVHAAHQQS